MDLEAIQRAVRQGNILFRDHAIRQMAARDIMDFEAVDALLAKHWFRRAFAERFPGCR
ncbi:MAG: hypothetical protein M3014_01495 [Chloroflexota bacterium]|nr:hypothetical protein [Chloroflexota bacterium]